MTPEKAVMAKQQKQPKDDWKRVGKKLWINGLGKLVNENPHPKIKKGNKKKGLRDLQEPADLQKVRNSINKPLTGGELIDFCLLNFEQEVAETSICIRAGYKTDQIGRFRRHFSTAAKVKLAPLANMISEYRSRVSIDGGGIETVLKERSERVESRNIKLREKRFRAEVLKLSEGKCVCCELAIHELLEAAHIVPVADGGSDSAMNGLALCPTHHRAFDRHLFAFSPESGDIVVANGLTAIQLMIQEEKINIGMRGKALAVRYEAFQKANCMI